MLSWFVKRTHIKYTLWNCYELLDLFFNLALSNEVAQFKEEMSQISAADTHLNLGEAFENRYNEIPYKQLQHDYVNGGVNPRNIFLSLCFSSWTLVTAVFLPERARGEKKHLLLLLTQAS